jgi:hypothetical protein
MSKMICHICKEAKDDDGFDINVATGVFFTDCKQCYDAWLMQVHEREEEELLERMRKAPVRKD